MSRRRLFLSGLRLRLFLLVLFAVLPALGLTVYTALEQRRVAVTAIHEDALRLAKVASAEQERFIESTRQLLVALAQLPAVRGAPASECAPLLAGFLTRQSPYLNFGVVRSNGEVACSALPVGDSVNLADRAYVRRAIETRDFAIGEYQVGRITGKASLNVGYPVLDEQRVVRAVLFAALDLGWLNHLASDTRVPAGATLSVMDRNGTILAASPNPAHWVGRSLAGEPLMRTIVARGEGVTEASLPGSPIHLVAFTPLSGTHQAGYVYLSLSLPKQTVFAAANRALLRNLVVLVVVGGLAFGGARVVADLLILRPVNALVAAAKRLGEGDLRARTGLPHGHSELSELAQVFDQMADAIERRQRGLETLYALDRVLAGAHRPEDVARMAVEHALPLLGFDAAAAYLLDEKTQALRLFHARELPPAVVVAIEILPVGAGVAGRAVQARRPLALPIDAYPGDLVPSAAAALRAAGFQTLAATPFVAHGRVYGALTLGSRARLEVSEAMLSLLTSVGTQIGVACAQAAERDRLATQERLAALGRLAAGVAHELKNPLSVITGRVALLRGQVETGAVPASERLVRHLTSLEEAEARMRRIMQGLSTYAKPPKPAPQLLRPADLLGATRELVAYQARKGGVTVGVDIAPDLPPVLGDRSQLMQVLLNLATNAIEAMGETGGQLVLRARVDDDPRENATRSVMVEVTDTGPGIPSDELETIWEPFYTTKPEGTGLGLSIVRSLVAEQPGAGIAVHSEPGQGTTFRLTMPAATPSGRPTP